MVVACQASAPPLDNPRLSAHSRLTARAHNRNYPWSLYAVFQTTITQWAFLFDCLLFAFFFCALSEAGYYEPRPHAQRDDWQRALLWSLFLGHFAFCKTVKLVPHLLRNPGDVRFVPASVLFGYFHNLIKLYGCITVTEVCQPRSRLLAPCFPRNIADHVAPPSRTDDLGHS